MVILLLDGIAHKLVRTYQFLLFNLIKGIRSDQEQSQIGFFFPKRLIFFYECATCSELPYDISTMAGAGGRDVKVI